MAVVKIKKPVYRCTCDVCGHKWDADELPKRCAKCKRPSWNGDKRRGPWKRIRQGEPR